MFYEPIIEFLTGIQWYWVLIIAFGVTIWENLFPPAPCDSILIFTGSLVSFGTIGFIPLLLSSTAGSVVGFLIMFYVGRNLQTIVYKKEKLKFISKNRIKKVQGWFNKYGYWIIAVNRFLTGTRAVISVFAGMSKLDPIKTTLLCALGSLIWNSILISLGLIFADNLEEIFRYLELYGIIILPIILFVALVIIIYSLRKRRKNKRNTEN